MKKLSYYKESVMWSFRTCNFLVQWLITRDRFDGRHMEQDFAEECRKDIKTGKLQCFSSEIRITERITNSIVASTFLGNSLYANPADFRDHFGASKGSYGSYFSDMVREAIAEARFNVAARQAGARRTIATEQRILDLLPSKRKPAQSLTLEVCIPDLAHALEIGRKYFHRSMAGLSNSTEVQDNIACFIFDLGPDDYQEYEELTGYVQLTVTVDDSSVVVTAAK